MYWHNSIRPIPSYSISFNLILHCPVFDSLYPTPLCSTTLYPLFSFHLISCPIFSFLFSCIRVYAECTSSNGSSSMASACGLVHTLQYITLRYVTLWHCWSSFLFLPSILSVHVLGIFPYFNAETVTYSFIFIFDSLHFTNPALLLFLSLPFPSPVLFSFPTHHNTLI